MSADPVLVEVLRGPLVESRHAGALAVADGSGRLIVALGDVEAPIFPRSTVKVAQALPLVESGAADALGFGTTELSIVGASHNGEPRHVATAAAMLARVGRGEPDLECGPQWPDRPDVAAAMHRSGETATQLHNNCSGKHAGFVCFACHAGLDPRGYVAAGHPVQREIRATMESVFACEMADDRMGIDGCSIPTWAIPLRNLAGGMARLATGEGLASGRAQAASRLLAAAMAEPFMTAGTGRFCTRFMQAFPGRSYVKTGAEGVYVGTLPELGLGFAVKAADGAGRAAEVAAASVVDAFLGLGEAARPFVAPPLLNRNRTVVGGLRPSAGLLAALAR